jgi:hypothetical protein
MRSAITPLERAEANLVSQIIPKRYEKGWIGLTANKAFSVKRTRSGEHVQGCA